LNGALTSNIVIDTSQAATDTIDCVATDQSGLTSTSRRTVIVEAPSIVPTAAARHGSGGANSATDSTPTLNRALRLTNTSQIRDAKFSLNNRTTQPTTTVNGGNPPIIDVGDSCANLCATASGSRSSQADDINLGYRNRAELEDAMSPYKVMVDDNFDYMDEDKRYEHGVFLTAEEAISACKRIVDSNLNGFMKPGMTSSELYDAYTHFGDDPFIVCVKPDDESVKFSAWNYAEERSRVVTSDRKV
jgi:hypothetical protein